MTRMLVTLAVAAALVAAISATAAAQEAGSGVTTLAVEPSPRPLEAGAVQGRDGGLTGRTMVSFNVNKRDEKIDRLRVRGNGCTIGGGAYITIRDSDGTIVRVADNRGSQIYRYRSYVAARGTGRNGAVRFFIVQRGNGTLDKYSRVRNSPNINC